MAKGKSDEKKFEENKVEEQEGQGEAGGRVGGDALDGGGGASAPAAVSSPKAGGGSESRQAALLASRIAELESQLAGANQRLAAQETAQRVEAALARSGAIDLETGLLLVERELAESPDLDVEAAVASVRQRKPFLFGGVAGGGVGAGFVGSGQSMAGAPASEEERLAGLADAALQSGDRGDVLRYLRARRS